MAYDVLSNFPEVELLYSTSAHEAVAILASTFSRHGIPQEVLTDNGPQFACQTFREFFMLFDFTHITSSPRFPRSNGLAEKGVQIVKRLLKKTGATNDNFWLALLNCRSSPLEDERYPSELLMGRRLRSRMPNFAPQVPYAVWYRNPPTGGKPLRAPKEGEVVRIWNDTASTRKAQVLKKVARSSYKVLTEDQAKLRRNRQHPPRPTHEQYHPDVLP